VTRKTSAIIVSIFAVWLMSPGSANAFEQQGQVTPVPAAPVAKAVHPAITLDQKLKSTEPQNSGRSFKLPGIGKLSVPKLNFGLDLMYGNSEINDTDLGFSSDPAGEDDVTIMGKVKRRF
jgi:hypothetical protein